MPRSKKLLLGLFLSSLSTACASVPASVTAWRGGLSHTTAADGQRLAYLDAGPKDGPPILLTHGLPTSSYLYRNVIPLLTARGFRVIAPDFVGFGDSSKPEDASEYAFQKQARRLLGLLDELKVERFALVVHDLGGLVSWEMLELASNRVDRLMVLDTTAYGDSFTPPSEMRQLGGWMGGMMSSTMSGSLFGPRLTRSFLGSNMGRPEKLDAAAVDNYWWPLHEGATLPMRSVAQNFDRIVAEFPRYQATLQRFRGPSSLLWGKHDAALSFEKNSAHFAQDLRIPPERVRSLEDGSHFIPEDHPKEVAEAILELMALPTPAAP